MHDNITIKIEEGSSKIYALKRFLIEFSKFVKYEFYVVNNRFCDLRKIDRVNLC